AGTSGLTILGFFLGQPDGALWQAVINRFLALFAIWVTAVLGLLYKKSQAR
ncbi:MAG: hypothetical protein GWM98_18050, partial [Nitrospinaceae bacterium]|nr:hypothetical protein [Nitrospinaceae bacterium]NIS86493.1 hypothetical protein [Nitrospinaceae bacterium]NIT83328.1 hypothetical protein [Nitrospinaceae bacterium]NIU97691.1 hypothetical protein [Nitrospinaceae bacterium]NIY16656.1 hypothetical protein [Nitrospinaceae bacterium]